MPKRQLILAGAAAASNGDGASDEAGALGSVDDVLEAMGRFNCHPDGSGPEGMGDTPGMATLFGPGMIVELPRGGDDVRQAMVTLTDDDYAWPTLLKLCRSNGWVMMDPESGRTFGG